MSEIDAPEGETTSVTPNAEENGVTEEVAAPEQPVLRPNGPLATSLLALLNARQFSDVEFHVGQNTSEDGASFFANRCILAARSTGLEKDLFSESVVENGVIELPDILPSAFGVVLEYIYADETGALSASNVVATLAISESYNMPRLSERCEAYISSRISAANVCTFLRTGHQLANLKTTCLKLIDVHAKKVLECDDFVELPMSCVIDVIQRDSLAVPEEITVFKACLSWAETQVERSVFETTLTALTDVLQYIRFPLMTASQLILEVTDSQVLSLAEVMSALAWQASNGVKDTRFSTQKRSVSRLQKAVPSKVRGSIEAKTVEPPVNSGKSVFSSTEVSTRRSPRPSQHVEELPTMPVKQKKVAKEKIQSLFGDYDDDDANPFSFG